MSDTISRTIDLSHLSTQQLKTLLGEYNNHIKYLEHRLGIHIHQHKTNIVAGFMVFTAWISQTYNHLDHLFPFKKTKRTETSFQP